MTLAILPLHHDYLPLSLTSIRSTVIVIEKPVIDIRVVEGLEAVMIEEEQLVADMETEAEIVGEMTVCEEDEP